VQGELPMRYPAKRACHRAPEFLNFRLDGGAAHG
jgi:hypothetical protein